MHASSRQYHFDPHHRHFSQSFEIVELRYSSSLYRHVKSDTRKLRLKFHQLPNMNNP